MKHLPIISPVKDGKLNAQANAVIRRLLNAFEGKVIQVEIKEYKKKRSNPQNAFYFGVVLPLVVQMFAQSGQSCNPEVVHRFLKGEIGEMKVAVIAPDGTVVWDVDSSTKLSTEDWEKWMEKIRAWAAAFDVYVPFPNEGLIDHNNSRSLPARPLAIEHRA